MQLGGKDIVIRTLKVKKGKTKNFLVKCIEKKLLFF